MVMRADNSATVSVVIATYNRVHLVARTIDNMLAQTTKPAEIIVVDDGSTDDTPSVLARYQGPVRYIRQANRGPAAARNAGLAAATGRFIQFMDDDDLMSLNKLEAQVGAMMESGADMAYCPWIQMTMDGDTMTRCDYVLQGDAVPHRLPLYEWHLRGWALTLQTCLFTREFLARAGALREDLIMTEDTEFLNRVFLAEPKVCFTRECLVFYRVHARNQLTKAGTSDAQKMMNWAHALNYMLRNLESSGRAIAGSTRFRLSHFAWRIHRRVQFASDVSREARERLESAARRYPAIVFPLYSAWLRVAGVARRKLMGTTWTSAYRPRQVGPADLRLMSEAGIRFTSGLVKASS